MSFLLCGYIKLFLFHFLNQQKKKGLWMYFWICCSLVVVQGFVLLLTNFSETQVLVSRNLNYRFVLFRAAAMSTFFSLKSMLNVNLWFLYFFFECICICWGTSVNPMVWQQMFYVSFLGRFATIEGKCLSGLTFGTVSCWYTHVSVCLAW